MGGGGQCNHLLSRFPCVLAGVPHRGSPNGGRCHRSRPVVWRLESQATAQIPGANQKPRNKKTEKLPNSKNAKQKNRLNDQSRESSQSTIRFRSKTTTRNDRQKQSEREGQNRNRLNEEQRHRFRHCAGPASGSVAVPGRGTVDIDTSSCRTN